MEIVFVYQRKRKEFGRQTLFTERPAELTVNIPPEPTYIKNYVERNPCHAEVQCAPEKSEHEVNTESFSFTNRGILHTQGGWPKDVDPTDVEHTIRYRKKIEKDEEYMRSIKTLGESMEHCIKQNNAIDIYEEYFVESVDTISAESPSAKSVNVYRDPNEIKRSASYLSWYPEDGHKIAVAYSVLDFQKMPANMSLDSYIWDIEKSKHSRTDTITRITDCAEFFSVSTDGQVMWWDIRKLSEPTETMIIDPERNGVIVGGTVLDFETTMPTKFMVGSENGSVFMCNKKAKNPSEKITHIYPGHHGPIYALQRNPFFLKNFLTIGDWKAQIWAEDVRSPIMSTKYSTQYLTDGCWSPTRPSVFFTSKMDGTFDVWDYIFKQHEPTLTVQAGNSHIQCIKAQEHGKILATTAQDGSTTLFELSDGLCKLQNNEKSIFSQMLEREAKREKTLESLAREKRIKAAQKRPNSGASKPTGSALEELIKNCTEDFYNCIDDGSGAIRDEAVSRVMGFDTRGEAGEINSKSLTDAYAATGITVL
ncbi:hypothetical protein BASA61_008197 [Batrachochytrium salamandrivorans]|nr:hypothetical protein BASA61_008197 [Batrachochytrium salamandrivorans]